jgi:hypothetical protein
MKLIRASYVNNRSGSFYLVDLEERVAALVGIINADGTVTIVEDVNFTASHYSTAKIWRAPYKSGDEEIVDILTGKYFEHLI